MKVKIPERRSIISHNSEGQKFTIPTKKNWFFIITIGIWIFVWVMGEITIFRQAIRGNESLHIVVILIALIGWTIGGLLIMFFWFWNLFGKEHIILRQDAFVIKKEIFGIGRQYEYDINNVKNLRLSNLHYNIFDIAYKLRSWGFGPGLISFDYGARTFHCASNIDEAEASEIIKEILSKRDFNKNAG